MFCDAQTLDKIVMCMTMEDWRPVKTDHFPIILRIDCSAEPSGAKPCPDFRLVDWVEFNMSLLDKLLDLESTGRCRDVGEAERLLDGIEAALTSTIDIPMSKPSP